LSEFISEQAMFKPMQQKSIIYR